MSDRHTFRTDWHHYNSGVFFVTICANHMEHIFGNIINNQMHFSAAGKIVKECVRDIPNHHKNVTVGNYVVMPNHVHIVLSVGAQYFAPATTMPKSNKMMGCIKPPRHGEPRSENHFHSRLSVVVRSFKAACSIEINKNRRAQNISPIQVWQRNYHEHIIHHHEEFDKIMNYVSLNVVNWNRDCFNKDKNATIGSG